MSEQSSLNRSCEMQVSCNYPKVPLCIHCHVYFVFILDFSYTYKSKVFFLKKKEEACFASLISQPGDVWLLASEINSKQVFRKHSVGFVQKCEKLVFPCLFSFPMETCDVKWVALSLAARRFRSLCFRISGSSYFSLVSLSTTLRKYLHFFPSSFTS